MRRKWYTILFLFCLLTGLLQPALPLLEYYIFHESIIELFCVNKDKPDKGCDGACYLKNQIEKTQDSERERPTNLLALEHLPILHLSPSEVSVPDAVQAIQKFSPYSQHYKSLHVHDIFHPPVSW